MIFVTVGTHEQPFNRLIKEIDRLKSNGTIKENVFIQTGFSTYEPKYCEWRKLIGYQDMQKMYKDARIVITHGGPASFVGALQHCKIPIVVPRQSKFNEHINNHQLEFAKKVKKINNNIIPIYDIKDLEYAIVNYDTIVCAIDKNNTSNNAKFCKEFERLVNEIMK